jgi:predicted RNA binding protein YcfA (HicA-like mRNA interferase family)
MPTKIKELAALLEADGWFQVRQRGATGSIITQRSLGP